jgi:superfamily II DNA or RNA helicase
MLAIQLTNTFCIVKASPELHNKLTAAFAYKSKKYEDGLKIKIGKALGQLKRKGVVINKYVYAKVKHEVEATGWDGHTYFYRTHKDGYGYLPTGLLQQLLKFCNDNKIEYKIKDVRQYGDYSRRVPKPAITLQGQPLREFQLSAVDAIFKQYVDRNIWFPRGIIKVATAGGKTPILAESINRWLAIQKDSQKLLVLIHTKGLLKQISNVLKEIFGEEAVGRVGDGYYETQHPIIVATVQTLTGDDSASFKPLLLSCTAFISDECHHLSAASFRKVSNSLTNAVIRIGLSATPAKDDIIDIQYVIGCTGEVAFVKDSIELEQEGFIAPVHQYYYKVDNPHTVSHRYAGVTYLLETADLPYYPKLDGEENVVVPGAYDVLVTRNDERNNAIRAFVASRRKGSKILVLVSSLNHGRLLANLLDCQFLSGEEDTSTREKAINKFESPGTACLIASDIFKEGINIPVIDYLVLAGCGKAFWNLLQRIGRGRRLSANKLWLTVLDFLDLRHHTLRKQSKARVLTANDERYTVKVIDDVKEIP